MNFLLGSTGLVGSFLVQELKNNEENFLAINRRKAVSYTHLTLPTT